jgi:hypothetical protein
MCAATDPAGQQQQQQQQGCAGEGVHEQHHLKQAWRSKLVL